MLQEFAVDVGIKHIVVWRTVVYVGSVVYLHRVVSRTYCHRYGVEFVALCLQSLYLQVAEYAVLPRCLHVEVYERIVYAHVFQRAIYWVVLLAVHGECQSWETLAQSLLVYGASLQLFVYLSLQAVAASHEPFISALGVQSQCKVATVHLCHRGVLARQYVEYYVVREVYGCRVSHTDV